MSSVKKDTGPKISVVVCSYNRGEKIRNCLDALINQSLPENQYEIVVVNDGSTDETGNILKEYKNIKVVTNNPNQGLAQSRNNGARASRADIIAFTDDDCIADKDWLGNILLTYKDPSIMGVGGKIVPYRTNKWLLKYYEANNPLAHLTFSFDESSGIVYTLRQYIKRSFSLKELSEKANTQLFMIVGANMSMRRSIFEAVGGFDPNIKFGGEEEDFWKRLRKIDPNIKLLYNPKAVIGHDYDPSFKDAARRNYKYGIGAARLFLKDRNRLPVLYPFPILILMSLLLLAFSPYFIVLSFALTLGLYSGWVKASFTKRHPQYLLFALTQMILELINSYGFFVGVFRILSGRTA